MLVIRKEHKEAFARAQVNDFVSRMVKHLRSSFPDKTQQTPDPQLRMFVRRAIANARKYDIVRECDVARYLDLMMTHSPDFDRNARAQTVLRKTDVDAEGKLNRLDELLTGKRTNT